jgi:hypothetical protein
MPDYTLSGGVGSYIEKAVQARILRVFVLKPPVPAAGTDVVTLGANLDRSVRLVLLS